MSYDKLRVLLIDNHSDNVTLKTIIDAAVDCSAPLSVLEFNNSRPDLVKAKSKLRHLRRTVLEFEKMINDVVSNEVILDYVTREKKLRGNPSKLIPGGKK